MIVPPVPAEAVIVFVNKENVATIEWLPVTLLKVYELIGPCETLSTVTSKTW